jgi:hypothetical protein
MQSFDSPYHPFSKWLPELKYEVAIAVGAGNNVRVLLAIYAD